MTNSTSTITRQQDKQPAKPKDSFSRFLAIIQSASSECETMDEARQALGSIEDLARDGLWASVLHSNSTDR